MKHHSYVSIYVSVFYDPRFFFFVLENGGKAYKKDTTVCCEIKVMIKLPQTKDCKFIVL